MVSEEKVATANVADDESASQQLLTEFQTSATQPLTALRPQPSKSSAVFGANLLNSVRAQTHASPSSPPFEKTPAQDDMARKKGKLKKPSIFHEREAQSKRRRVDRESRHHDVYTVQESPAKGMPFRLGELVNHKPLKIVKTRNRSAPQTGYVDVDIPSSPSILARALQPPQRKSSRLAGQDVDISHVDWERNPEAYADNITRPKQKDNTKDARHSPKRIPTRLSRQPEVVISPKKTAKQAFSTKARAAAKASLLLSEDRHQVKRRPADEDARITTGHQEQPPTRHIEVQPCTSRRGRPRKGNLEDAFASTAAGSQEQYAPKGQAIERTTTTKCSSEVDNEDEEMIETGDTAITELSAQPLAQADWDSASLNHSSNAANGAEDDSYEDETGETVPGSGNNGESGQEDTGFDIVFKFLKSERRRGRCSTDAGTKIRQACDQGVGQDTSIQDVLNSTKHIQTLLSDVSSQKDPNQQVDIKVDAYSYLFRALAKFLKAVYNWARKRFDAFEESLEAMRIIKPLISGILSFKDAIAHWKVKIPSRYAGDRLLKNVHESFITPLRRTDKYYEVRLSQLEAIQQASQTLEELHRKNRQREEREQRVQDGINRRNQRWLRWQALHVRRKMCEPDDGRCRSLDIIKFEDLEERDANGIPFERVPLLKERVTPHPTILYEEDEWSDEQIGALSDGLEKFAGPYVFERIFETYCRPQQHGTAPLRDFTVVEITAKAAIFKRRMIAQYQSDGYVVPDWMERIPVLP